MVILAVVMDTCFCCIRAIKEHEFNSCFGIDGAIRSYLPVNTIGATWVTGEEVVGDGEEISYTVHGRAAG